MGEGFESAIFLITLSDKSYNYCNWGEKTIEGLKQKVHLF